MEIIQNFCNTALIGLPLTLIKKYYIIYITHGNLKMKTNRETSIYEKINLFFTLYVNNNNNNNNNNNQDTSLCEILLYPYSNNILFPEEKILRNNLVKNFYTKLEITQENICRSNNNLHQSFIISCLYKFCIVKYNNNNTNNNSNNNLQLVNKDKNKCLLLLDKKNVFSKNKSNIKCNNDNYIFYDIQLLSKNNSTNINKIDLNNFNHSYFLDQSINNNNNNNNNNNIVIDDDDDDNDDDDDKFEGDCIVNDIVKINLAKHFYILEMIINNYRVNLNEVFLIE